MHLSMCTILQCTGIVVFNAQTGEQFTMTQIVGHIFLFRNGICPENISIKYMRMDLVWHLIMGGLFQLYLTSYFIVRIIFLNLFCSLIWKRFLIVLLKSSKYPFRY